MEQLIKIWLHIGYTVYWIGWIGSMIAFNVSYWSGIGIGLLFFIVHIAILQILFLINGDGWIWNN